MTDHAGHDASCACREYRELTRRQFVGAAAGVAAAAVFPAWLPRVVLAPTFASDRDVIVSVFQRGGVDGLNLVVPYGDPDYYAGRNTIAIPRPDASVAATQKVTAIDSLFGFAPAMLPLVPAFASGNLLAVHAAGQSYVSRSHFDAQRFMEVGKPNDPAYVTGWLGRHLALMPPMRADAPLRAIGVSNGLQKTLVGAPQALPIANPANFSVGGSPATAAARQAVIAADYADAPAPLNATALAAVDTIALLQNVNFAGYAPMNGASYPNTSFGRALKAVATLIRADVGIEAAQVDIGGWDTHASQGGVTGTLASLTDDLASSLAAFHADVVPTNARVTVVVVSEFGRNARENGSQGTDHGRGTTMFAMGQGIVGGRVLADWPGLAIENLEAKQDLKVTIDYRDVLAEIVQKRLGNTLLDQVFPGWTPTFRGVAT
ncbi:MAG TPA: DUF1501 domain-containing protein [Gemmatimonadaceae bacterium]|nr:DUF1501 domain-containing protein [Gemmatimonadaceae bacterium]